MTDLRDVIARLVETWREGASRVRQSAMEPGFGVILGQCANELEQALAALPSRDERIARLIEMAKHAEHSGSFNMTADVAALVLAALPSSPDPLPEIRKALSLGTDASLKIILLVISELRFELSGPPPRGTEVLCERCAANFCPHGEELHFHHDGCPACDSNEAAQADPAGATPAETGKAESAPSLSSSSPPPETELQRAHRVTAPVRCAVSRAPVR